MGQGLEIAFIDKLYPREYLPLEEVEREPAGSLFWTNSRGLERVFAYQGGADFIGLDVDLDVQTQRRCIGFVTAQHTDSVGQHSMGHTVAPVIKVGMLAETVYVRDRSVELMKALMEHNVTFWSEYIDWCRQGLVQRIFKETESYAEKMQLATEERDTFTKTLEKLGKGALQYKDQVIWLDS